MLHPTRIMSFLLFTISAAVGTARADSVSLVGAAFSDQFYQASNNSTTIGNGGASSLPTSGSSSAVPVLFNNYAAEGWTLSSSSFGISLSAGMGANAGQSGAYAQSGQSKIDFEVSQNVVATLSAAYGGNQTNGTAALDIHLVDMAAASTDILGDGLSTQSITFALAYSPVSVELSAGHEYELRYTAGLYSSGSDWPGSYGTDVLGATATGNIDLGFVEATPEPGSLGVMGIIAAGLLLTRGSIVGKGRIVD